MFLSPHKVTLFILFIMTFHSLTILYKISFKHDGNLCCETTICIVSLWIPLCCYAILPKNHFDLLINSCPWLTSKCSCHLWYFIRKVLNCTFCINEKGCFKLPGCFNSSSRVATLSAVFVCHYGCSPQGYCGMLSLW